MNSWQQERFQKIGSDEKKKVYTVGYNGKEY